MLAWALLCCAVTPLMADIRVLERVSELDGVSEYRLANGLRAILAPDAKSTAVAFNMIYLTGSLADPQGQGGTAHLLEHLLFKGTAAMPGAQLVEGLSQRGIKFNATTSFDRTRYMAFLAADAGKLNHLLALEADRMFNARFDQADLQAEVEVVLRELELAQDNPLSALGQHMFAAATPGQGFGRSVLGSRKELKDIGLEQLRAFYQAHYRPDNAVIVITGKFDSQQTLAAIEQHFAPLAAVAGATKKLPPAVPVLDKPVTTQLKRGTSEWLALAYPLPGATDPANSALAALPDMLAGEPHGRLYQTLVVPGQASAVTALQQAFGQGGYMLFAVLLTPGQSRDELQKALLEQVEGIARNPLDLEELQRFQDSARHAKAQILASHGALSDVLAESVAVGDWQLLLRRQAQFAQLSAVDVQRQAERHFVKNRRLVGQLLAAEQPAATVSKASSPAGARQPAAVNRAAQNETAVQPVDLAAFNQQVVEVEGGIQRFALDNGLKVALRPLPGVSTPVQGRMTLRFGDVQSLAGKRALTELTGTALLRGTYNRSYQKVVDQARRIGAGLSIVPEGDALTVQFSSPPERLPSLLNLLADILKRPAFKQAELDLVKRHQQHALQQPIAEPAAVASLLLSRHNEQYPLGDIRRQAEPAEKLAELAAISRDEVVRFHQEFYGANHGEFALSGDFDPQQVREQLHALFGDWNSQAGHARPSQPYQAIRAGRIHAKANAGQTGVYIGQLHYQANSKKDDAAALYVAEHLLGRNQMVSRLSKRLREQEGLTYGIKSSMKIATFDDASWLMIQASYPLGYGPRLADMVKEELQQLIEGGITEQELEYAKQTILHERRLAFAQEQNILSWLPRQLYEGVTMQSWVERNDAFAAVTVAQVNAVMRRYFNLDNFVEVLADADGETP
ncbi:M16 family metallopeptidase [Pseudomonas sp. UBA2684]|uniref:M16 family metallopeptidase n=1 Tax=Pseudomonas sp. UBA2684 TaxID=1947311 RepID=UPI0025EDE49F|nr:pitrilysin family protein [Pseudomonas sp. UBA2684]